MSFYACITLPIYLSVAYPCFPLLLASYSCLRVQFSFYWIISFNRYFCYDVNFHFLSLCLKTTISPFSSSHVLAACRILRWYLFSFTPLKVTVYCVLASIVTGEKSGISLIITLIDNLFFFSLRSLLWCFFLTLMFWSFTICAER